MKLLVDSDFLVGLFRDGDPHQKTAIKTIQKLKKSHQSLVVLNLVVFETATVLSYKVGMNAVRLFHEKHPLLGLTILPFDLDIESKSWEIFLQQTKKGTSFVDCANLATIEYYKLDGILSFDSFYPRKLKIN